MLSSIYLVIAWRIIYIYIYIHAYMLINTRRELLRCKMIKLNKWNMMLFRNIWTVEVLSVKEWLLRKNLMVFYLILILAEHEAYVNLFLYLLFELLFEHFSLEADSILYFYHEKIYNFSLFLCVNAANI